MADQKIEINTREEEIDANKNPQEVLINNEQQKSLIEKLSEIFNLIPDIYKGIIFDDPAKLLVMAGLKPATEFYLPGKTYSEANFQALQTALEKIGIKTEVIDPAQSTNGECLLNRTYIINSLALEVYSSANNDLCPIYYSASTLKNWLDKAATLNFNETGIYGVLYGFPRSAILGAVHNLPSNGEFNTYNESYGTFGEKDKQNDDILFRETEKKRFFKLLTNSPQYKEIMNDPKLVTSRDEWAKMHPFLNS